MTTKTPSEDMADESSGNLFSLNRSARAEEHPRQRESRTRFEISDATSAATYLSSQQRAALRAVAVRQAISEGNGSNSLQQAHCNTHLGRWLQRASALSITWHEVLASLSQEKSCENLRLELFQIPATRLTMTSTKIPSRRRAPQWEHDRSLLQLLLLVRKSRFGTPVRQRSCI